MIQKRISPCDKCAGLCCRKFTLSGRYWSNNTYGDHTSEETRQKVYNDNPTLGDFLEPLGSRTDTEHYYRCRLLDPITNRCTAYDRRPGFCKNFRCDFRTVRDLATTMAVEDARTLIPGIGPYLDLTIKYRKGDVSEEQFEKEYAALPEIKRWKKYTCSRRQFNDQKRTKCLYADKLRAFGELAPKFSPFDKLKKRERKWVLSNQRRMLRYQAKTEWMAIRDATVDNASNTDTDIGVGVGMPAST